MSLTLKPMTLEQYETDMTKNLQDQLQLPIGTSTQALIKTFAKFLYEEHKRVDAFVLSQTPKDKVKLEPK